MSDSANSTTPINLGTFVVLWGHYDKQFHVETIRDFLDSSLDCYYQDKPDHYSLLGFAESEERAQHLIDVLKEKKRENE